MANPQFFMYIEIVCEKMNETPFIIIFSQLFEIFNFTHLRKSSYNKQFVYILLKYFTPKVVM